MTATATDGGSVNETTKGERMLTVWLPTRLYDALDDEATRLKRSTSRRASMSSIVRSLVARRLGMTLEDGDVVKGTDPYAALEAAREALEHAKRTGSISRTMRDRTLAMVAEALDGDELAPSEGL